MLFSAYGETPDNLVRSDRLISFFTWILGQRFQTTSFYDLDFVVVDEFVVLLMVVLECVLQLVEGNSCEQVLKGLHTVLSFDFRQTRLESNSNRSLKF